MDRLEEMRTFIGVVEAGGIARAAERLGIAKSAVSPRPADLEDRCTVQLLRRHCQINGGREVMCVQ